MTHDDAFLQAITESPDDDGPRLVYADWLDEHGQPERAEFIRVQCGLAQMAVFNDHRRRLQARQQHLLASHGRRWLKQDWPRATNPVVHAGTFARGFVAELAVCGRQLGDDEVRILVSAPPATHLTALHLRKNRVGAAGLAALANSPRPSRLAFLDLRDNLLGSGDVRVLAASPHLLDLRELVLGHKGLRMDEVHYWFRLCGRDVAVHGGNSRGEP